MFYLYFFKLKTQGQTDMRDFVIQAKPLSKMQLNFIHNKVLKFIIENSQPFYILESKSFKELLLSLNPYFEMPTDEALDKLLDQMFDSGRINLKNIFENVEKICLTTDFWTSRGQHGYIGVTAHWTFEDYELKEAFLALQHVYYPHTSEIIKNKLMEIIVDWNISDKVVFITTDNAASMVKSIRLLGNELDIKRISCAAHTLQLVIGKALSCNANIQIFILRVKRLVYFFSTPKQLEHLIAAQKQLNYSKTYRTVKDVQTRWNSSFYSWKRLLLLKNALVYLPNKLKADQVKENAKDGLRLERIMLSEDEWKFMENLVEILKNFESITRILGGSKYITLSLIYPLIFTLKDFIEKALIDQQLKDNNYSLNTDGVLLDNNDVEDEILEGFEEIPDSEIADTIEINEKGSKKRLNILKPIEIKGLVKLFLEALDLSLKNYWSVPSDVGLISTLLDPRSKKLVCFNDTDKQKANTLLIKKYEQYLSKNPIVNTEESVSGSQIEENPSEFDLDKSLMNSIFEDGESDDDAENEVDVYFNTKVAKSNCDPLLWWKNNEKKFPILSKFSKEFFGVSATSVPSERLFSDVGNVITNKRSSLKPEKVEKLIFLKRNASLLNLM